MLRRLLLLFVLASAVAAVPLQNITLPLPAGTSNHGTPGLLCTPTKWTDIALFYLFNYVAHAATVLTRPGERSDDYMAAVVGSFLFPALGLYRGIEAILGGVISMKRTDDLRKAAGSGALCMVVRGKEWTPVEGDEVSNAVFRRARVNQKEIVWNGHAGSVGASGVVDEGSVHVLTYSPPWVNSKFGWPVYVRRQIIHGTYNLPVGYRFVIVPPDTHFTAPSSPNSIIEVSATYNLVKAMVALVQSIYAIVTLYRSRGDQISQFGFAAFGLTVAPYAVMSAMNLIGNICRPDYASLYMVENSIMEEARRRGGVFEGSVGRVQEESNVCGCGLSDGDDTEDLHFSSDGSGTVTAEFGIVSPPDCHSRPPTAAKHDSDKSVSMCSSLTPHSHSVQPLPEKLDYVGTRDDALILVPCCNPIRRSRGPAPSDIPHRHRIEGLALRKVCPPFKLRHWCPKFAPSAASTHAFRWRFAKYFLTTVIALSPLAITGALSHFHPGTRPLAETSTWRAYTLQWLLVGVFIGIWWVIDGEGKEAAFGRTAYLGPFSRMAMYIISSSPAVGGYVVVGQMLSRYGVCTWVGS